MNDFDHLEISPVQRLTFERLAAQPDEDEIYRILEEMEASQSVRFTDGLNEFVIESYLCRLVLPSCAGEIQTQLTRLQAIGVDIAPHFISAPLLASGETALVIGQLPDGMHADSLIAGKETGKVVTDRAIESFCNRLKPLARQGESEERAFDPTNWLYDTRGEIILLRHVSMPCSGEPSDLLSEIERFRTVTTG